MFVHRLCDTVVVCGEPGARRVGRSVLGLIAVVALGAFGIGVLAPDSASARASGVSRGGSRATTPGSGLRGHPGGASRHSAVPRNFVLGRGGIRRHGGTVAAGLDGGWPSVSFGDVGFSGCQVQRVQINDDYGWRVRDAVICPWTGISP
jgi:hypothetical protein